MRVLLVQNGDYGYAFGGAIKANRFILDSLAARGHACAALTPARDMYGLSGQEAGDAADAADAANAANTVDYGPVAVHRVRETTPAGHLRLTNLRAYLPMLAADHEPDVILVASEDQAQVLLRASLDLGSCPVVYVARSSSMLGVGPLCFFRNDEAPSLFARTAGIVTNSRYLSGYLRRWAGYGDSFVFDPPSYGRGPFPGPPAEGAVTLINPCAVKGLPLFLRIVRELPRVRFAAVPTWGTTSSDRAELERAGVELWPPSSRIDDVFARTRVLVVPSLWDEAFGRVAVEAMLRGIPVLASRVGGLPEAKLGEDFLLDVEPVRGYQGRLDERRIPIPVVGPQEPGPWVAALRLLLEDPAAYDTLSRGSREAADRYLGTLDMAHLEDWLEALG